MILYINACVRPESRTDRLAKALLNKLGDFEELKLNELSLMPLDNNTLEKRNKLIDSNDYDDHMFDYAKQFAAADIIVISAPYWDLSFPSILKIYFESILISGLIFSYSNDGIPESLCRADRLYYVTTAGVVYDESYSYGYISALAKDFFGINNIKLIKAEKLDIAGSNPEQIIADAIDNIIL